jgi:hypothetical protein
VTLFSMRKMSISSWENIWATVLQRRESSQSFASLVVGHRLAHPHPFARISWSTARWKGASSGE